MIYTVHITAPAINEEVTLATESEEAARRLAVADALGRQAKAAEVTVTESLPPTGSGVPDPPRAA